MQSNIENQKFGLRLKEERKRLGFTQENLAIKIDLSPVFIE